MDPLLDPNVFIPESKPLLEAEIDELKEGLGRLPATVTSVDSLLLFNTAENPYKKYVAVDNIAGEHKDKVEEDTTASELIAAPTTLLDGEDLPSVSAVEYSFRPDLGNVPQFQLPADLPDLDMVAQNISFHRDDELSTIAPSTQAHLVDDLPDLDTLVKAPKKSQPRGAAPSEGPPPPVEAGGPPPPDAGPPPPDGGGPPPPGGGPPPPTGGGPPPPGGGPPVVTSTPAVSSGRGGLLADIQKGHKSRLKAVDERQIADAPPSISGDSGSAEATGSIFGDLLAALTRRQASIRGEIEPTRSSSQVDGGDIAMPNPHANDNNNDAEWDSDGD
eukprot:TRINITY_DN3740_c0_g2_i1.p1 TRINITY_DN3740_c0_g2~~TRINITY_DN3740_c0_g2_i1.p1  ORF type:complete len:354 (+),score=92.56 TRINITY_DN3740_c0_g2_i1:71-1063(+)